MWEPDAKKRGRAYAEKFGQPTLPQLGDETGGAIVRYQVWNLGYPGVLRKGVGRSRGWFLWFACILQRMCHCAVLHCCCKHSPEYLQM